MKKLKLLKRKELTASSRVYAIIELYHMGKSASRGWNDKVLIVTYMLNGGRYTKRVEKYRANVSYDYDNAIKLDKQMRPFYDVTDEVSVDSLPKHIASRLSE